MLRIIAIDQSGTSVAASDSVHLDYDQRSRRRAVFRTQGGASILLDMARPAGLKDGDALTLEDGSCVRVEAMAETLMEIGAVSTADMVRIAWHLGNRHLPTQLVMRTGADPARHTLRIRHDHVIADMVKGLGGSCEAMLAPFDPEGGAYAGGHGHAGHSEHADNHSHGHAGTPPFPPHQHEHDHV